MAKQKFIATVQVLLPEDITSEAEACDFIAEAFRELFDDWSYARVDGQYRLPAPKTVSDDYEEGEAFS